MWATQSLALEHPQARSIDALGQDLFEGRILVQAKMPGSIFA
jgi:hypothetical protein